MVHGRAGRGDVRLRLLVQLQQGPAHGYELMRRLEEASGGAWKASPGSVYPTLSMLEDEGALTSETAGGKKVYRLTEVGRDLAAAADGAAPAWDQDDPSAAVRRELREAFGQLHMATKQVGIAGTPEAAVRALEVVRSAKREIYLLLADT